ncbi:MAG: hypothetical protein WBN06_15540 [Lysobacterales bacterium]
MSENIATGGGVVPDHTSFVWTVLNGAFDNVRFRLKSLWKLVHLISKGEFQMANTHASEELLAAPLPELIRDLGLAVAGANMELAKAENADLIYTVDKAEIELKVAISISQESKGEIKLGGTISVFNVNASYARTYGYKEEASSLIKLSLAAKPRPAAAA